MSIVEVILYLLLGHASDDAANKVLDNPTYEIAHKPLDNPVYEVG